MCNHTTAICPPFRVVVFATWPSHAVDEQVQGVKTVQDFAQAQTKIVLAAVHYATGKMAAWTVRLASQRWLCMPPPVLHTTTNCTRSNADHNANDNNNKSNNNNDNDITCEKS